MLGTNSFSNIAVKLGDEIRFPLGNTQYKVFLIELFKYLDMQA